MVILPRNEKKQTEWIKNKWPGWCDERRIIIPEHVVNGLDLMWHSDFVVSGGRRIRGAGIYYFQG